MGIDDKSAEVAGMSERTYVDDSDGVAKKVGLLLVVEEKPEWEKVVVVVPLLCLILETVVTIDEAL